MYKENDNIYNNLCGCLCNKCFLSLCFGSKYKSVPTFDDDQDDEAQLVDI